MDTLAGQEAYEAGREQKQSYLYQNIVEAGYDAELFAQYMQQNREDGLEIDNWSFEDLVAAVTAFTQPGEPGADREPLE